MSAPGRESLWDRTRTAVWFLPSIAATLALVAALALIQVQPARHSSLAQLAWPGDRTAASNMLQVVAGSVMTVTSLTFTLVVIALQLASQQYSPRLLREFARDRVIQAILAILVATFVFAATTLRGLEAMRPLPSYAVLVGYLLGMASIAALLVFIGHIARILRIDSMMVAIADQTRSAIDAFYPPYGADLPDQVDGPADEAARPVPAGRSGFIRSVDPERLVAAAQEMEVIVEILVRAGDHVVAGTPLARATGSTRPDGDRDMDDAVRAAVGIGFERSLEEDPAYGFRQLTDIAVKALSPAINDPATAAHAVGHMADLLTRLIDRRLGDTAHAAASGVPRVLVPDRDLRYYLDGACGQIRRYGADEPTVLVALLRMLRDVAMASRDDQQRAEVTRQVDLVLDTVSTDVLQEDRDSVRSMAGRVQDALAGQYVKAYTDRAGETRSV